MADQTGVPRSGTDHRLDYLGHERDAFSQTGSRQLRRGRRASRLRLPLARRGSVDIVVGREAVAKLLNVEAMVDGAIITTYRADGVVVATATGSTAYAMSIGGPIVSPDTEVILLHPVAAHLGFNTCLVISENSTVELHVKGSDKAILSADGTTDADLGIADRSGRRRRQGARAMKNARGSV